MAKEKEEKAPGRVCSGKEFQLFVPFMREVKMNQDFCTTPSGKSAVNYPRLTKKNNTNSRNPPLYTQIKAM